MFNDPQRPDFSIQVDLWPVGSQTRLELWALDVEAPARPAASLLKGPVTSVDFRAWPAGSMNGEAPVSSPVSPRRGR